MKDWAACGIHVASQLSHFAKGDPEELVTRELMLTLSVPGFAYNGANPGDRYYWPKYPYSDIVLLCQQSVFVCLQLRSASLRAQILWTWWSTAFGGVRYCCRSRCLLESSRSGSGHCCIAVFACYWSWGRNEMPRRFYLTAYHSEVHNCMIWKHDGCLLNLPKRHSGDMDPNF